MVRPAGKVAVAPTRKVHRVAPEDPQSDVVAVPELTAVKEPTLIAPPGQDMVTAEAGTVTIALIATDRLKANVPAVAKLVTPPANPPPATATVETVEPAAKVAAILPPVGAAATVPKLRAVWDAVASVARDMEMPMVTVEV